MVLLNFEGGWLGPLLQWPVYLSSLRYPCPVCVPFPEARVLTQREALQASFRTCIPLGWEGPPGPSSCRRIDRHVSRYAVHFGFSYSWVHQMLLSLHVASAMSQRTGLTAVKSPQSLRDDEVTCPLVTLHVTLGFRSGCLAALMVPGGKMRSLCWNHLPSPQNLGQLFCFLLLLPF